MCWGAMFCCTGRAVYISSSVRPRNALACRLIKRTQTTTPFREQATTTHTSSRRLQQARQTWNPYQNEQGLPWRTSTVTGGTKPKGKARAKSDTKAKQKTGKTEKRKLVRQTHRKKTYQTELGLPLQWQERAAKAKGKATSQRRHQSKAEDKQDGETETRATDTPETTYQTELGLPHTMEGKEGESDRQNQSQGRHQSKAEDRQDGETETRATDTPEKNIPN